VQGCTGTVIEEPSEQQEQVSSQESQLGSSTANLVIASDWGGGYCANVTLTNGLSRATTRWQAIMDLKGSTISGSWNASFTAANGKVTATPVAYNTSVAPAER
jgi:cellulase/cellobiase CelA1